LDFAPFFANGLSVVPFLDIFEFGHTNIIKPMHKKEKKFLIKKYTKFSAWDSQFDKLVLPNKEQGQP